MAECGPRQSPSVCSYALASPDSHQLAPDRPSRTKRAEPTNGHSAPLSRLDNELEILAEAFLKNIR